MHRLSICFFIVLMGCTQDTQETQDPSDMNLPDLDDMQDEEMTNPCGQNFSTFVANRTYVEIEGEGTMMHDLSMPNTLSNEKGIGAKLEAGVLYLYFMEESKSGNLELSMEVHKTPESLPVQYCVGDFYDDSEPYCSTGETRTSFTVYTSNFSTSGMAHIDRGTFELSSCPGPKGSRVIGRFIDTNGYFDVFGELYSTFDAEFNVVLFESDESWDCSQIKGGVCDRSGL